MKLKEKTQLGKGLKINSNQTNEDQIQYKN